MTTTLSAPPVVLDPVHRTTRFERIQAMMMVLELQHFTVPGVTNDRFEHAREAVLRGVIFLEQRNFSWSPGVLEHGFNLANPRCCVLARATGKNYNDVGWVLGIGFTGSLLGLRRSAR